MVGSKRKITLLTVVPYLYPALSYGGPAKVVYDLNRELSKHFRVTIYTSDSWNKKRRIKEVEMLKKENNFEVKYFKNISNHLAFKYKFFTNFGIVSSFIKDRDKFDIVHVHDLFSIPQLLLAILAQMMGKKTVISPHGVLDPVRLKQRSLIKSVLYKVFAKRALLKANLITATSEEAKHHIKDLGFKKVEVLSNSVTLRRVKKSTNFEKFNNKKFTILYIGRLHKLKGVDRAIKALYKVKSGFQFLIAGPNDGDKENLEKLVDKYKLKDVHFLGYVNDNQKEELFAFSDVFIYPSHSEGFSISILESLSRSVPVIITKECNFPEVEEYKAGFIVDNRGIISNIRKSIEILSQDKVLLDNMRKNAFNLYNKKYSIDVMTDKMVAMYMSIL